MRSPELIQRIQDSMTLLIESSDELRDLDQVLGDGDLGCSSRRHYLGGNETGGVHRNRRDQRQRVRSGRKTAASQRGKHPGQQRKLLRCGNRVGHQQNDRVWVILQSGAQAVRVLANIFLRLQGLVRGRLWGGSWV